MIEVTHYHFHFHGSNDAEVLRRLKAIKRQLTHLETNMANRDQELNDKLDLLQTTIDGQQTVQDSMIKVINDQRATIVELKAQVEAGAVISAGTLDAALARMDAMIASENLQTDEDNNVITQPPPPPAAFSWSSLTEYDAGDRVVPTVANGFEYSTASSGTSGDTEPTWPTVVGETVPDGNIVWATKNP